MNENLRSAVGVVSETVFQEPLPNVSGKELRLDRVTYGPGGAQQAHRSSAFTLSYVLEGSVVIAFDDGPETLYGTGDVFAENPFEIRAVSRNASEEKRAAMLRFAITDLNQ